MSRSLRGSRANHIGRWVGHKWRAYLQREARAFLWLQQKGMPSWISRPFLLVLKMLIVGVLLYSALWLGLVVLNLFFIAWGIRNASFEPDEEWAIGEQTDHKKSVFYDPINYNDTDDPRFDD